MTKKFKLEVVFEVEGNIDITPKEFKQEMYRMLTNFELCVERDNEENEEGVVQLDIPDYWNTVKVTDVTNEQ